MLGKDAPDRRPIERFGDIVAHAILANCITGMHESSFWKRQLTSGHAFPRRNPFTAKEFHVYFAM